MIFNEVVIKYIKFNQSNKQTKQTYLNILKHHWIPALGNLPIESITTESILEVLIEKELSDKYTNQILIPLRVYLIQPLCLNISQTTLVIILRIKSSVRTTRPIYS